MVYRGKPSRGCHLCRSRRIKCDEQQPACSQCAKTARRCPGYPVSDKNGSKEPKPRAHPQVSLLSQAQQSQRTGNVSKETMQAAIQRAPRLHAFVRPLHVTPTIPMLDQAECLFLSQFVLVAPHGTNRGFYEFIPPLLDRGAPASAGVLTALKACALELFNNQQAQNGGLKFDAVKFHTKAISETRLALEDPKAACDDSTIGSILLLLLFEIISCVDLTRSTWRSHLVGAMRLIESRGRSQLLTTIGVSIFTAVRVQLILFALISDDPIHFGNEWWMTDTFTDKYAALCLWLTVQTTNVRSELSEFLKSATITPDNWHSVEVIMGKCRHLDQGFVQWSRNLPEYYQRVEITWVTKNDNRDKDGIDAFPGRIDAFGDPWLACIWNMMRCSRLELAGLMARCSAFIHYPTDYRTTAEYSSISNIGTQATADLIASIPYQLGWFSKRRELLQPTGSFVCGDNGVPKALSACIAVWPLMYIRQQDFSSDMQRTWATNQLVYIGLRLGVRYATAAAQSERRVPSMTVAHDIANLEANMRQQIHVS